MDRHHDLLSIVFLIALRLVIQMSAGRYQDRGVLVTHELR